VNLFDSDETFPRLSPELLAMLDAAGSGARSPEGEVLYRAGDRSTDFFVVLSGLVAGIDGFSTMNAEAPSLIASMASGVSPVEPATPALSNRITGRSVPRPSVTRGPNGPSRL
jgi:hypothetical protein